jgi:hypothetical protein
MVSVILPIFRRTLLSGACVLLLAGCGGGDDNAETPAQKAAAGTPPAADSAGPAFSPPDTTRPAAAPADSGVPVPRTAVQDLPVRDTAKLKEILAAPVTGPVNVQTLANYRLTMDVVRGLVRAGQNLAELQARRPELADSARMSSFDPNAIYEKINGIPEVRDAVTRAGMSPRDYSMGMAALAQAVMVYQMRERGMSPPVPVNEANIDFVDEHWEEIQQLAASAVGQARPRS